MSVCADVARRLYLRPANAKGPASDRRNDPRPGLFAIIVRRCPTLPQGPPCSTIGAERLSFRVRNVTGRFPHAMTTETPRDTHPQACQGVLLVVSELHSRRVQLWTSPRLISTGQL